jgi:bifunctional DNA-binding transcriptional regulator/antitoxin component of YhaV-PrlF toxin-antitoxin module
MTALTVTAKGQITLRRGLLQHLGIAPGQQLEVDQLAGGVLVLHVKTPHGLESFVGCLPPPARALTLDELNTLSRQAWAQEP